MILSPHASELSGRVCLVTGATQGIGKVTALELARRGADVLIVARDPTRGAAAVEEIRKAGKCELLLADLSKMSDVRALADEVARRRDRLHVLCNNAGAMHPTQGHRRGAGDDFATNHLAYFLLTKLLLPLLERGGAPDRKARIVNVASAAHLRGRLDFDDLQRERGPYGGPLAQYSASKLMNILFTYELARRLQGKNVTANCLHPGVVATGFGRNDEGWLKALIRIGSVFFISPEKGAETSIYLATSDDVEGVSGKYFASAGRGRARARPTTRPRSAALGVQRVAAGGARGAA